MDNESFKAFKDTIQKKYPKSKLHEKKLFKGKKPAIEFWTIGKHYDGSIGQIIVGIYYLKPGGFNGI